MILISEGAVELEVVEFQRVDRIPAHDAQLEHFYSVSGHKAFQHLLLSFSPADSGLSRNLDDGFRSPESIEAAISKDPAGTGEQVKSYH